MYADNNLEMNTTKNKLSHLQSTGFYKTNYVEDCLEHWSEPPYINIKPSYRPSESKPLIAVRDIKQKYSLKPWGEHLKP